MDYCYKLGQLEAYAKLGLARQKLAFGPAEANKVLQVAKSKQLPRAGAKLMNDAGAGGIGALIGSKPTLAAFAAGSKGKQALTGQRKFINALAEANPLQAQSLRAQAEPTLKGIKQLQDGVPGGGAIVQRGPVSRTLKPIMKYTGASLPKDPAQHKMLEAINKGHELHELSVQPRMAFKNIGHNSPDVLLREHNMVTTLPKDFDPVRDIMQKIRAPLEGEALRAYGVDYGKGERLSRHARKRITERMENDMHRHLGIQR